jgi:hypothetical protein
MKRQKEGVGGRERTRAEQKNEGGKSPRRKRWTNGEERRKECTRPEKDEDDEGGRAAGRGWWVGGGRGRDASYSAQHPRWRWQRLPSSLKSIIKKYIRGHLRFSSAS